MPRYAHVSRGKRGAFAFRDCRCGSCSGGRLPHPRVSRARWRFPNVVLRSIKVSLNYSCAHYQSCAQRAGSRTLAPSDAKIRQPFLRELCGHTLSEQGHQCGMHLCAVISKKRGMLIEVEVGRVVKARRESILHAHPPNCLTNILCFKIYRVSRPASRRDGGRFAKTTRQSTGVKRNSVCIQQ